MNSTNLELKHQLLNQIETLGKEQSLLPFADRSIDRIIEQLENRSPISQPLKPEDLATLCGEWELVYASNGTVITRPIAEIASAFGSAIRVNRIWQSLNSIDGEIIANNQALVELPLLGEYKLNAEGVWRSQLDKRTSIVKFYLFSLQATQFLSQSNWMLPEIQIPILDLLQNEAAWITSYLDENMRIGKGVTGNLFLFRR